MKGTNVITSFLRRYLSKAYKDLSPVSKIAYAILLDRLSLSKAHGWAEKDGSFFIYFKLSELESLLNISHKTAARVMNELRKYELIDTKRQGCGLPKDTPIGLPMHNRPRTVNESCTVLYVYSILRKVNMTCSIILGMCT